MPSLRPRIPPRLRKGLRNLKLLLFNPAQWSAEHYAKKNTYEMVATTPDKWPKPKPKELDP
jgi:hypothetical protein